MPKPSRTLLAIIEFGAYPNFIPLYEKLGYEVLVERSVRKALSTLRRTGPTVVVAEFNYQSDFRDRTSSLESVFSVVQTLPETKVIVFYDPEQATQFQKLQARFRVDAAIGYPVEPGQLEAVLRQWGGESV